MAAREFLSVVRRRWYVAVVGAMITLGALVHVMSDEGVYYAKTTVAVLIPPSNGDPNILFETGPVAIAGLAVMDVNHAPLRISTATSDATLYGMGERSGTLVQLRNAGGQWTPSAQQPYIDIEAVDSTPDKVVARIRAASRAVRRAVNERQAQLGVRPIDRVWLQFIPVAPAIIQVPPSFPRFAVAILLIGLVLSGIATTALNRLMEANTLGRRLPWRTTRTSNQLGPESQPTANGVP